MTKSSEHNLPSTLELERSVQLFKAFGDQTRYKILSLLSNKKLTVNEIADEIGITQGSIINKITPQKH